MDRSDTVIFACSALEIYVSAAQEKEGTCYPAVFLDKENHMEPKCMRQCILDAEKSLPATVKNVLVAMGFCGGALDSVSFSRRFVIPRVDDCVSMMLQTDGQYNPNPKETGHLYMMEPDPEDFSLKKCSRIIRQGMRASARKCCFICILIPMGTWILWTQASTTVTPKRTPKKRRKTRIGYTPRWIMCRAAIRCWNGWWADAGMSSFWWRSRGASFGIGIFLNNYFNRQLSSGKFCFCRWIFSVPAAIAVS